MTNKDKEYFDDVRREIEKARKAIENKYLGRYAHTEATHRITENALFTLFAAEYAIEAFDDTGKLLISIPICFSTPMTEDDIVRFADIMLK